MRWARFGSVSTSQRRSSSRPAAVIAERAAAARALADDLDHARVLEPGELGIDLAVARVPRVGERDVEPLRQLVAGARLHGEQPEHGVAEGHGRHVYARLDMSNLDM